ncbi:MAG TPA: Gfo/Idh/MocA family oxidoreductase [Vicinamibacteria bacterium]|nr:Gfo/Idh/MocA family oxidoreductase [Vicinamibacteria bacterium]
MERRAFLGTLAAGAAALGRNGSAEEPKDKIRLGLIGCGWYGLVVSEAAFKAGGVELIAVCDADNAHLVQAADKIRGWQGGSPRAFKDWRELLGVPGLQGVIIATPPHWHALPFIEACRRGLDIYCEKPLAYDVREGRAMVDAAKASGRVVQVGFQRRHSAAIRQAKQYIAEGNAGRIVTVAAQIHYPAQLADPTPQDPPATLDWDLWCGPAPKLPYSPQVGHFNWRAEEAYGNGHLVDWGIHWIDAIRVVLGLGMPRSVQSAGGLYRLKGRITTPDALTAHFEYDGVPVTWTHRIFGSAEYTPETTNGMFFYGEKETVYLTDERYVVIPTTKGVERRTVEAKNDQQTEHVAEWLEAVRTRGKVSCPPEDAYRSTAAVQLAMIALKAGGRVDWDASTEQVLGNPKAAALVKREYRGPWVHPWKG